MQFGIHFQMSCAVDQSPASSTGRRSTRPSPPKPSASGRYGPSSNTSMLHRRSCPPRCSCSPRSALWTTTLRLGTAVDPAGPGPSDPRGRGARHPRHAERRSRRVRRRPRPGPGPLRRARRLRRPRARPASPRGSRSSGGALTEEQSPTTVSSTSCPTSPSSHVRSTSRRHPHRRQHCRVLRARRPTRVAGDRCHPRQPDPPVERAALRVYRQARRDARPTPTEATDITLLAPTYTGVTSDDTRGDLAPCHRPHRPAGHDQDRPRPDHGAGRSRPATQRGHVCSSCGPRSTVSASTRWPAREPCSAPPTNARQTRAGCATNSEPTG